MYIVKSTDIDGEDQNEGFYTSNEEALKKMEDLLTNPHIYYVTIEEVLNDRK